MVRRGRVGPGGDDREVRPFVAFRDEPLPGLTSDVGLGPAHEPSSGNLVDHAVGGQRGPPEQLDLVGILDHAKRAGDGRGGPERDPRQSSLEPEQMQRPERVVDPHARRSADRTDGPHGIRDQVVRIVGLFPGHDLRGARGDRSRTPRRIGFEAWHDQDGGAPSPDDEHRQALERHGDVAGEVAQVRANAHEERAQPLLPDQPPGRPETLDVARRRNGGTGGELRHPVRF